MGILESVGGRDCSANIFFARDVINGYQVSWVSDKVVNVACFFEKGMSMKKHEKRIQQLLQLLHILLRSTCFHIWIGRLLISHPVSHFSSLLLDHETNSLAWFFVWVLLDPQLSTIFGPCLEVIIVVEIRQETELHRMPPQQLLSQRARCWSIH